MPSLYSFSDLQTQVLTNLDEAGATGSSLTLTKNFLNQAHQARLAAQPWKFLEWDTPETFSCVVNQRTYALHSEFWRPIYFFNRAVKNYLIEVPNRQLADTQARWNDQTGSPLQFRLTSRTSVAAQPTSTSTLSMVSSSAADTTAAKALTIKGVTSNGVTSETLTPTGTTPVVSTNSYTKILAVSKGTTWAGNMTLTSNSAAVTNLFLFPTELARSYQQIEFLVMPASTDVIEYKFTRQPTLLVNDSDIPDIPFPHSNILVWDALLMWAGYNTDISPKSLQVWIDLRNRMELQLAEAFMEGQSLESEPRYVRFIDGDMNTPRIFTS